MTTAYAFESAPDHIYRDHPESPRRFDVLEARLPALGALPLASSIATREDIRRAHTSAMIDAIEATCSRGGGIIDVAPTFVTATSFDDALRSAGASLTCVRAVLSGEADNAFAIARPPGHHAEPERAMGFCIFNNVAVAARAALAAGLERIAIVDFDAHHGNGTEAIFLDDEHVAYLSTHQWGIYPGSGWLEGPPSARKRIVNVPLPAGAGNAAFARIADDIIDPFVSGFKPELILVSAGFDAHWGDPLTSLSLSTTGFYLLSARLAALADDQCSGRIVFVLEGGYNAANLANGCEAVFSALMHKDFNDPGDASRTREPDVDGLVKAVRLWHGFGN